MKKILLIASLVISPFTSAQLYKWVDPDGVVHYSDRNPGEQTQQEALPDRLKNLNTRKQPLETETALPYTTFEISSPKAEDTVRNADDKADIVINIQPPLTEPHFLQVYLDGLQVGEKTKSTALTLQQMKKGLHRLQAHIVDEQGLSLMKTEEISFTFRRPADLSKIAPNLVPPQ